MYGREGKRRGNAAMASRVEGQTKISMGLAAPQRTQDARMSLVGTGMIAEAGDALRMSGLFADPRRENVNDTNQVVIVDLSDANNVIRRPSELAVSSC